MEPLEKPIFQYSTDYQISFQMKSWVAINPAYGCIWDCVHCIQHKDRFFAELGARKVHRAFSPEEVIAEIMTNPKITSQTPLVLYNFSDPFLPQNASDLRQILTGMDKRGFTNIVGLITKTFADYDTLDTIESLQNLRVIVLVSYPGYTNRNIENGPLSMRIKLARELNRRKIKVLQYLRPVVKEWLEQDQFTKARDDIGRFIDGVVMGGIRITPEIITRIKARGLPVPRTNNYENKFFPTELQDLIIELYQGVAPVYRYTSCGVSATLGMPDYNDHLGFFRETQNQDYEQCPLPCKKEHAAVCMNRPIPDAQQVKDLLKRIRNEEIKFIIKPSGAIIFDQELSKYELSFLRQNTFCHIDYSKNKHFIDRVTNMEVKSQK